jgi:hypothetical protein
MDSMFRGEDALHWAQYILSGGQPEALVIVVIYLLPVCLVFDLCTQFPINTCCFHWKAISNLHGQRHCGESDKHYGDDLPHVFRHCQ